MGFDYSAPYSGPDVDPPATPKPPVSGIYPDVFLSTIPQTGAVSYTPIQSLSIGASECVELSWSYTLNDSKKTQWRHNFHRTSSASGLDMSQTAYAVVSRLNADSWEVEPSSTASCNSGSPAPALARLVDPNGWPDAVQQRWAVLAAFQADASEELDVASAANPQGRSNALAKD